MSLIAVFTQFAHFAAFCLVAWFGSMIIDDAHEWRHGWRAFAQSFIAVVVMAIAYVIARSS